MRATPCTEHELRNLGMGHGDGSSEAYLAQEVSYLRAWIARSARIVEAQTLDLASLAKCRRIVLEQLVDDLRSLARAEVMPHAEGNEYGRLLAIVETKA